MTDFVPSFVAPSEPRAEHHWFCVHSSQVLLGPPDAVDVGSVHYLGQRDGVACWAIDLADHVPATPPGFTHLYGLYSQVDETAWLIAGRAVQVVEWDRTHRFCGRCATPTELSTTDRSRVCPACRLVAYPRLAPAVITLVTRGTDEVLLGRGVNFGASMYSCLAGFVEPGETLEEAVVREIYEEVGVRVGTPRYVRSQPWPFPHSLMVGFVAPWVSGDIVCDPTEIADAQWFRRDSLPSVPPSMSIAGRLIAAWVDGSLAVPS